MIDTPASLVEKEASSSPLTLQEEAIFLALSMPLLSSCSISKRSFSSPSLTFSNSFPNNINKNYKYVAHNCNCISTITSHHSGGTPPGCPSNAVSPPLSSLLCDSLTLPSGHTPATLRDSSDPKYPLSLDNTGCSVLSEVVSIDSEVCFGLPILSLNLSQDSNVDKG